MAGLPAHKILDTDSTSFYTHHWCVVGQHVLLHDRMCPVRGAQACRRCKQRMAVNIEARRRETQLASFNALWMQLA